MKKPLILLLLCLFAACGGQSTRKSPDVSELTGLNVISALTEVIVKHQKRIEKSIAYVEITGTEQNSAGRNKKICDGVAINNKGYILLPIALKKEQILKIQVWLGDDEFEGKFLESQTRSDLRLSLVQVLDLPEGKLLPLSYTACKKTPKSGSLLLCYAATGERTNFDTFVSKGTVMATLPSIYNRILFGSQMSYFAGAPIVDVNGHWVGIFEGNSQAILLLDLQDRIDTLIEKAEDPEKDSNEKKMQPWAGFVPEVINEDYAIMKQLPKGGIWVKSVFDKSPAYLGGMKPNDLIVKVNNREIRGKKNNAMDYFKKLMMPKIGRTTVVTVIREGIEKEISLTFVKSPEPDFFEVKDLGITVTKITDMAYQSYNLDSHKGVLISKVERGSPAATNSGFGGSLMSRGDVVLAVNGISIKDFDNFKQVIREELAKKKEVMFFKLKRDRYDAFEAVNLNLGGDDKNSNGKG